MDEQPRIPVLDDLGGRLERAFRDGERARVRRPKRLRWRLALALAALGMLAVPTAIGTQSIWAPGVDYGRDFAAQAGKPVRVADGEDRIGRWWLVAQQTSKGLCVAEASDGGSGGSCNDLVPGRLEVSPVTGPRYFGWTSLRVATVRIASPAGAVTMKTFPPAAEAYRRGGFTQPFRLFISPAPDGSDPAQFQLEAFDRAGRVIERYP